MLKGNKLLVSRSNKKALGILTRQRIFDLVEPMQTVKLEASKKASRPAREWQQCFPPQQRPAGRGRQGRPGRQRPVAARWWHRLIRRILGDVAGSLVEPMALGGVRAPFPLRALCHMLCRCRYSEARTPYHVRCCGRTRRPRCRSPRGRHRRPSRPPSAAGSPPPPPPAAAVFHTRPPLGR